MTARGPIVIWLLGAMLLLSSSASSADSSKELFPLSLGNTWTYGGDSYSVAASRTFGGHEYLVFDQRWVPFFPCLPDVSEVIVRNTQDGDIILRLGDEDILYYEFSNTALDSLRVVPALGTQLITCLESLNDTVVTPAGTFDQCLRFWTADAQVVGSQVVV